MRILWHGIEFIGDEGPATFTIDRSGASGLLDGVSVRGERPDRPNADGAFDAPAYLGARSGSITGLIHADSAAAYETAVRQLTGIPPRALSTMVAELALGDVSLEARRVGSVEVRHLVYGSLGRYMVSWNAPDPRLYGVSHVVGPLTSVDAEHDGNAEAFQSLVVAGSSGGGYTLSGPDSKVITVTEPLVSGHPHTLDLFSGTLFVDGAQVVGGISVYQPWTVPVGASVTVLVSAGTVTSTVRDTYV
jgi:hypothetical protein